MVKLAPSTIHPRISFKKAHVPSPLRNFFWDTGSSPLCCDISGGGNIEWMPWIMALEKR